MAASKTKLPEVEKVMNTAIAVRKKVLLVDDHPLVRQGLASIIHDQGDLEVVGEAASTAEALAALEQLRRTWRWLISRYGRAAGWI